LSASEGAVFRLVVHPKMEGQLNMAVDEALAEAVGRGESPPVIRLYGFSPATLSLGRFQKTKGQFSFRRLAADGVTLVRRPTGGHAVLHDDELTYSVALPKSGGGLSRKREVYLFIADMLLAGLSNLGIRGTINAAQQGDIHNPDCFGSAGEYEISGTGGRKLIGSAQMTTRTAILQHGSIPLRNPGAGVTRYLEAGQPLESHPPSSLNEESGRTLGFEEVREAFARGFQAAVHAELSEVLPAEYTRAEEILAAKYGTDAWNLAC
jgi:lipoate-protein ligase A